VRYDFDPEKAATNLSKYGLSLAAAAKLSQERALAWVDDRTDDGEARMIALAPIGEIHLFVAFVDRGTVRRIIGLPRAKHREVNHIVKAINAGQLDNADTGRR
jgi:uncharacterized DUF497 family protein